MKGENDMEDIRDAAWRGYLRQNGMKGIRNKLLVIYTVKCSAHVAKEIARLSDDKNVETVGFDGCCDNEYAVRLLLALARHPNVGAVLAVGLGCEYVQAKLLAEKAGESGRLSGWFLIQEHGGTLPSIRYGLEQVKNMLEELKRTPIAPMGFRDLIVGAECGGSDYTSGLAGNVLVGRFYDRMVDLGGTAIFEEIVEAVGLKSMLEGRAADEKARAQLAAAYDKALEYCKSVRQYSVSPGNFAGGLSSIEEKSMGALAKSGSRPVKGVLKVSQTPPGPGLWLLDSTPDPCWMGFGYTNPNDSEGLMDLISCGAQLVFLVTGRGNVVGSAVSPVFKITGNSSTFRRMSGDMDFDAGPALSGELTLDELCGRLFGEIARVCSGAETNAEKLGHKEYFIPYKYQEKKAGFHPKCREAGPLSGPSKIRVRI
jgi:altronate hydrolase